MPGAETPPSSSRRAGLPTVSVIIPSRNAAPYIRAAIDSALAQTHPVLEVLVIDGGSKDGTQEIVTSYGAPVRLLDEHQNGGRGIAAARNVGVQAAAGEWLAFLDADDWWEPGKTAAQFAELANHPDAALNYTSYWMIREGSGDRTLVPCPDAKTVWPALRWTNGIGASTVMARRDALVEVGAFREDLVGFEDWEMWVRLRLLYSFTSCADPLMFYRILPQSISHDSKKHLDGIPEVCDTTMVAGLSGLARWTMRRRVWAAQLYACALVDRENSAGGGLPLLWRSLAQWPLPTFMPIRYKVLLNYLAGRGV